MTHPNNAAHQKARTERLRASGLAKVTVIVPEAKREELKALAKEWTGATLRGPTRHGADD